MRELVKAIRTHLSMSQAELAERLGVTFATVNRWENGRATPGKMAQVALHGLCAESGVPLRDMLLEKIARIAEGVELEPGRILLYHGSKTGIEGAIRPISRPQCDFGRGFYMGTEPLQALMLVCEWASPRLYLVSVDPSRLSTAEIPADMRWAMLVAYHRGKMEAARGTALYDGCRAMTEGADLVVGCITNDRMFFVMDSFFAGNITDAALVGSLSALDLGVQYVAVSQRGCDAVRVEREVPLSHLEWLAVADAARTSRELGVSLAGEVCRQKRREGLFFDELVERAEGGAR